MSTLEALIFDVDGTLADTERDGHRVAFNRAFADAGLEWEWSIELYGKLLAVTGGKDRIRYYLNLFENDFERPDNEVEWIAGLHAAKTVHFIKMLSQRLISLRRGVRRLIDDARNAGMRIAIATTTSPDNVTALLENTLGGESVKWFEVIGAGDIVAAKKPAPDIYWYVLDKMEIAPDRCIAFEDSRNGLLSSLGAKVPTIVTTSYYTQNEDFTGACLVVDRIGEPNDPFEVQAGDVGGDSYLTLNLIRKVHEQAVKG